jgi:SAM-dependent methyltransferase
VSLVDEYQRQLSWRDWSTAFAELPLQPGQLVLDLGCSVGDQAAELVARGARVIGVDGNEALLAAARARALANAEFRRYDLAALPDLGISADGLWCSFVAAYFPALPATLISWLRHLRRGGWVAFTEIDDLFGHQPLSDETRSIFDAFAHDALEANRYDFHMGRKLKSYLEQCGCVVSAELLLADQELSCQGPAQPEVIDAWRARFARMKLLQELAGADFPHLRDEFLACLARPDHHTNAKVYCCVARAPL